MVVVEGGVNEMGKEAKMKVADRCKRKNEEEIMGKERKML